MAMVGKILSKIKIKVTRITGVFLAAMLIVISMPLRPIRAAEIAVTASELAPVIIGVAGMAGITFATDTDAMNFAEDYFHSLTYEGRTENERLAFDEMCTMLNVTTESGSYVRTFVNDAGEKITEVSTSMMDGASRLLNIGMDKVDSLLNSIYESFDNFLSADGTLSTVNIDSYANGYPVYSSAANAYSISPVSTISIGGRNITVSSDGVYENGIKISNVHGGFVSVNLVSAYGGIGMKETYANGALSILWSQSFFFIDTNRSDIDVQPNTTPYTATLSPQNNIFTDTPAAVASVAALGGITAGTTGTYTRDDVIGVAIPMPGSGTYVGQKADDVVIDLGRAFYIPAQTTAPTTAPTTKPNQNPDPTPTPSPSPTPSPKPVTRPLLPPILTGIGNLTEKITQVRQKTDETAVDDGTLDGVLNDLLTELLNMQDKLKDMPQDDPSLLPQLEIAKNTITGLQEKVAEQEQAIINAPEKYPDPALLEELQNLKKELEELKESMQPGPIATPDPIVSPGTETDYTSFLERIIILLTGIKEKISTMPETLSDTIIGSGELKPPGRGGGGDDSDDDDLDWSSIFPFCIPFDLVNMFERLVGTPAPPRFEAEIMGYTWVMDFAEYDYIAQVIRVGLWISFIFWLMLITSRLIKWH